jgi:hypothetical protein
MEFNRPEWQAGLDAVAIGCHWNVYVQRIYVSHIPDDWSTKGVPGPRRASRADPLAALRAV